MLFRRIAALASITLAFSAVLSITSSCFAADTAADYPRRPVHIVVPSTPGGAIDFLARLVGAKLSQMWHEPVVIDNRPGAGGIVGSSIVANASPDGLTLLMVATGYTLNPSIYIKLPYDTLTGFDRVTLLASTSHVLVANPKLQATTIAAVLQQAKQQPGKLTYATSGRGTGGWLCGQLLKNLTGANMLEVPYKGSGEATTAVITGQTDMEFTDAGPIIPFVQQGQLHALAVSTLNPLPQLPTVPTLDKSGAKGFDVQAWVGVLAPAHTSPDIVAKIQHDMSVAIQDPSIKSKLELQGYVGVASTPASFDAEVRSEITKWAALMKSVGIKPTSL